LRVSLHTDSKAQLANRAQLTTGGHRAYLKAVEDTFGAEMNYAMLQKIYGTLENHEHALVFYFMYDNFCRIHQTLWWWHTFKCTTNPGFHSHCIGRCIM